MHINLYKLKTGDKVAFSEKVEKTVSNICRDNIRVRSVSFDDGTILDWDNSLWELAGLEGPYITWENNPTGNQTGWICHWGRRSTLENECPECEPRFHLAESPDMIGRYILSEHTRFDREQEAKDYAEERAKQWRSSCGD